MNTLVRGVSQMSATRLLRAYCKEATYEFLRMLRSPAFAIPTLIFPTLFYLLVGYIFGAFKIADPNAPIYMFVGFATMAAMTPGMFSFGVAFASEREQGVHQLKRALPMPAGAALIGKIGMSVLSVSIAVPLLSLTAVTAGGVSMGFGQFAVITLVLALGAIPFCSIGLLIGTLASARAAPAIVNMVYLLMIYLSRLFIPLPEAIEKIVFVSPAFYLHQLALNAAGEQSVMIGGAAAHGAVLCLVTVVFAGFAIRRFARAG